MKQGISEFVAEGDASDGSQVRVYRALRELLCTRCSNVIATGDLFTRRLLGGIYLTPQCSECVPFQARPTLTKATQKKSSDALLDSLFEPSPRTRKIAATSPRAKEESGKRLGPALARRRRRQP